MKKVVIDFKQEAFGEFKALLGHKRLGGLARKYYEELLGFPPAEWGKLRLVFGKNTFVSDRHLPFVIKVIVMEDEPDLIHLYVTEFRPR